MPNRSLIVGSITLLLMLGPKSWGSNDALQSADRPAQSDSSPPVPDAPQPQKKPASKPKASSPDAAADAPSPTTEDKPDPKQPAAKSDNAFPEDVSREAAKAAAGTGSSDAQTPPKSPTRNDNPFPEAVSRDAAKAAGSTAEQAPPVTPRPALPPGVSSSQTAGDPDAPDSELGAPTQIQDPVRARKDVDVGGYYLKRGDYQGALQRYKDATAADPTNVEAIFGLAETQRSLKNNAEAARDYQMYLEIVPDGPKSRQALKALKALQSGK